MESTRGMLVDAVQRRVLYQQNTNPILINGQRIRLATYAGGQVKPRGHDLFPERRDGQHGTLRHHESDAAQCHHVENVLEISFEIANARQPYERLFVRADRLDHKRARRERIVDWRCRLGGRVSRVDLAEEGGGIRLGGRFIVTGIDGRKESRKTQCAP